MDNIYEEYGKAMVQAEMLNNRINDLKRLIVQDMEKQNKEKVKDKTKEVK